MRSVVSMNDNSIKAFWLSLSVLVVVHSIVSFGAFRLLTKTTSETRFPDRETIEKRSDGITVITNLKARVVTKVVPNPVIFYVWCGYGGLAAALIYAVVFRLRHA
jgi:hypothetical protein